MNHLIQHSLYFVAGLSIYAACVHLVIGLRKPRDYAQVIFACMSAILAMFCMFHSLGLLAQDKPQYIANLRWSLTFVAILHIFFPWFIAAYCHTYRFRWLVALSLAGLIFIPFNFLTPFTLQYEAIDRLYDLTLPWGEVVSMVKGTNDSRFALVSAWIFLIWVFGLSHLREEYQRNPGWRTIGMLLATAVFFAGSLQGALVRMGYIEFIPMGMYGFVVMLLAMGILMLADATDRSDRMRHILDHVPAVVYMKDLEGHFLMMNRHYEEQFGIPSGTGIGRTDRDYFPEAQCAEFRRNDMYVANSRQTLEAIESADRNGETRSYLSVKFPVLDAGGNAIGIAGVSTDITERIKAERALQESEQRFRVLADSAPVLIWLADINAQWTYFNEPWFAFTGRTLEQERGQGWTDGVHPDDLTVCLSTYRDAFAARREFRMEYRLRRFDGEYRWFLDTGVPTFDESQLFGGYIGSCIDITERKKLEYALTQQTEQMDAVFSIGPDGFVAADDNTRIVLVNPAFTEITGIEPREIIGKRLEYLEQRFAQLLGDARNFDGFGEFVADSTRAEISSKNRWALQRPKASVIEIIGRCSRDSGMGVMLFFRDKTHEFEVENMKSEFLAVAAHELRTPTTSILGFSELLLSERFDEKEHRELLQIIQDQSIRVSQILDELLDLARIEARRGLDFVLEDFDLDALVSSLIAEKGPASSLWTIQLRKSGGITVRADRKKTYQALSNVLSNAIKYSPNGGTIVISIGQSQPGGGHRAKVEIADPGIGMTPEQVRRIFERFFRADSSGQIPGTGLGMSIVREIMEIQGGSIDVASGLGKGTTITLWFQTSAHIYAI